MTTAAKSSQAPDDYILVPIVHLLKHPEFFIKVSTYIKAAEKYIQLNYAEDSFKEILANLVSKGGTHVYLKRADMEDLLFSFQKRMTETSAYSRELHFQEDDSVMMLAHAFIKNNGISPEVTAMIESSNKRVQGLLSKTKNIKSMLDQMKQNCSAEYFKITFTNYICSMILNHFEWKTSLILDKLMLASTVCDLSLSADDFADLEAYEIGAAPLSEKLRHHPFAVIELLKVEANDVSLETITIIKQHHERPDGKGFPIGIDHGRINQLSALFIVAHRFVDVVCSHDNEGKSYSEVAEKIKAEYQGGFFTKAGNALVAEVAKIK